MAGPSKIEWTDATWNPLRGCTRVSPGCGGPGPHGGCYAEAIAARFSDPGQPFHGFATRTAAGPRWTGKVALVEGALPLPLSWKKPRMIFVNSMSDLFHEGVPDAWIDRVFAVMALCPQHTFQVLTKRSGRMRRYFNEQDEHGNAPVRTLEQLIKVASTRVYKAAFELSAAVDGPWPQTAWPLPNVWLGVSCEDQPRADERVPDLLATPAAVRFVSAEPLLGGIDFGRIVRDCLLKGLLYPDGKTHPLGWIIVGGESGPRARPMHPDWARSIRDQCAVAGTSFFFKQHGEFHEFDTGSPKVEQIDDDSDTADDVVALALRPSWITLDGRHIKRREDIPDDETPCRLIERVGKKAAGRVLDGRTHDAMPQVRP